MEFQRGYCGLRCDSCPLFIARLTDDHELRIRTCEEWSRTYAEYLDAAALKPEDFNCSGCRSESQQFTGCVTCSIRKCCSDKSLSSCALCKEFEVCPIINGFLSVPAHSDAKEYLEKIFVSQDPR